MEVINPKKSMFPTKHGLTVSSISADQLEKDTQNMAKQTPQNSSSGDIKSSDAAGQTVSTPQKKNRNKPIKYDDVIPSAFDPVLYAKTGNPLDGPAVTNRGRLEFTGVEFITTPVGSYINIPAKGKRILGPTLRQIVTVIDGLYAEQK